MSHSVGQSIKGGRCSALNQYYKPTISDEVFKIVSKALNVIVNVCGIIDNFFEYLNKRRKILENDYDSKYKDFRDSDQEGRTNYMYTKLTKLPIHEHLKN